MLQQQLCRSSTHFPVLDAQRGQRRIDHVDQRNIVVANDRNILWAAQALGSEQIITAKGHQVVGRYDGCRIPMPFEQLSARNAA